MDSLNFKESEYIWEKSLAIVREELSEISFETWLEIIKPISIYKNTIYLGVPSDFEKSVLECRYSKLIKSALRSITESDLEVKFFTGLYIS